MDRIKFIIKHNEEELIEYNKRLDYNKRECDKLYKQLINAKTPKEKKQLSKSIKDVSIEIEFLNECIKHAKREIEIFKGPQEDISTDGSIVFWVILGVLFFFIAICVGLAIALQV